MRITAIAAVIVSLIVLGVEGGAVAAAPDVSLHTAALLGDIRALQQHVEAGSDLNQRDRFGSTPLLIAATFDRPAFARALIDSGADPDARGSEGGTALHAAAFLCRTEIVRALLDAGANKYLRDDVGNTPFETVAGSFQSARPFYDRIGKALAPLGLKLDYERIRPTRPEIAAMLRPTPDELKAVDYAPRPGEDWPVSTPAEQGLDRDLVAELYLEAGGLRSLYGLLVIRNDRLIAEGYFNEGAVERKNFLMSVTKSYTSALVGVALQQGCLSSVDEAMLSYFPEAAAAADDPGKARITVRHLLQMRAGYPWEEREPPYFERLLLSKDWQWLPHIAEFALSSDPGTDFGYSNLTSHILAMIVARACEADLRAFGQEKLFSRIDAEVGEWHRDANGYRFGSFGISFTARDMAKFGSLYLHAGEYRGARVLPAAWVEDSLRRYSEGINFTGATGSELGRYIRDLGYGYQWWSARAGEHRFDFAWGHGGNLIVLLHDLDLIIVTAADPQYERPGSEAWPYEGAILNAVGKFIASLPSS